MKFDNKYLLQPALAVSNIDKDLANTMMTFMRRHKGYGLAANQVGYNCRLFVMDVKVPRRCFNPMILEALPKLNTEYEEGCLSYPDKYQIKPRHLDIIVSYYNQDGKIIEAEMNNLEAVCFQHELDHLNGIQWNV